MSVSRDQLVAVVVAAVLMLAAWYAGLWWTQLPALILPPPHLCLAALWKYRWDLLPAAGMTALASVCGLSAAIAIGGTLSILFSQSRILRAALFPYVLALQTVPVVAAVPLLIVWSGYTFRSVLVVTVLVCLFPIVNTLTIGLTRIDPNLNDLFRLQSATRWQQLSRLAIPSAIPDFIMALKTGSGLAVIGAIVAEFFVSTGTAIPGLGFLMTAWQMQNRTDAIIAALAVSAALGLVLYAAVHYLSFWLLRRWIH